MLMTMTVIKLAKDAFKIESAADTERVVERQRHLPFRKVKRCRISWNLCGGIGSSVVGKLLVGAGGRQRVFNLMMMQCHS